MPVLASGLMMLSTFSFDSLGETPEAIEKATERLIAKVPTLAAYGYKNSRGEAMLYPDNSLSYVENFLRMSFGYPTEPYEFHDEITRALDVLLADCCSARPADSSVVVLRSRSVRTCTKDHSSLIVSGDSLRKIS